MNALSYTKGKNQGAETHVCVSIPIECSECVIRNPSAKQFDWLSHSRPALFPFPLFLFPVKKINDFKVFN